MLRSGTTKASIVVCSTCRLDADRREDETGQRGGSLLADALRQAAANRSEDLVIEDMPCLFACKRYCTVHLRAEGKVSYVLGDFEPTESAANAILDYFEHYLASKEGVVPYKLWPEGVKGHFITRSPPTGKVME